MDQKLRVGPLEPRRPLDHSPVTLAMLAGLPGQLGPKRVGLKYGEALENVELEPGAILELLARRPAGGLEPVAGVQRPLGWQRLDGAFVAARSEPIAEL